MAEYPPRPLHFTGGALGHEWYRPVTMAELATLVGPHGAAEKTLRLVCANTGAGVAKYLGPDAAAPTPTVFVDVSALAELQQATVLVVADACPLSP